VSNLFFMMLTKYSYCFPLCMISFSNTLYGLYLPSTL
jgi:hypothetical protein